MHESLIPFEERCEKRLIRKVERDNLVLYTYTEHCVFEKAWDEYTIIARGIIFDKETGICVAKPFPKFFNLNEMPETRIENLPKETPEVYEKFDGSLGILYRHNGELHIATKGSFASDQAKWGTECLWLNHPDAWLPLLHDYNHLTLLFEIMYPGNNSVCNYSNRQDLNYKLMEKKGLILLGGYNRFNGTELTLKELSHIAEKFDFIRCVNAPECLDDLIEKTSKLSKDQEGFVLKYSNGLRVKLKGDEYLKFHKYIAGITPLNIWAEMKCGHLPIEYVRNIPEEYLEKVLAIEVQLWWHYRRIHGEILKDVLLMADTLGISYGHGLLPDERKRLGQFINVGGPRLTHPSAVFPMFLHHHVSVDKYIMKLIRPTGNMVEE